MKLHIKKGDKVRVLSGKDRGEEGEVLLVLHAKNRAIVEGVNMMTKAVRPDQQNPDGGIIQQEAAIHTSNLMLLEKGAPTRTGRMKSENGKGWERYSKKTGEKI